MKLQNKFLYVKGNIMKKEKYLRYEFENGMVLYYAKNTINSCSLIEASFDCGARCDGEIAGLAHFCEHMFFTGTKKYSKQEISKKYFDFIDVNAYTTIDDIKFSGKIFTEEMAQYLSFVAEIINDSTFTQQAVDEEKKVVVQEIVGKNDDYSRYSYLNFNYLMFEKKYYLNGVLGNVKSINSIKSEDVKNFVKKYFVANNCNLYVVSPLEFEQVKDIVEANFASKLKRAKMFEPLPFMDAEMTSKSKLKMIKKDIDKNFLLIGFKVPCTYLDMRKTEALDLLCGILGDFSDGILKVLRLELGLVYGASFYFDVTSKGASLIFSTSVSKENIKQTIDVLSEYVKKIKDCGISQEQLDKEKREKRFAMETRIMHPKDEGYVLKDYRKFGKFIEDKYFDELQINMPLDEVNTLVKEIFSKPNIVSLVYGDAEKQDVYSLKELQQKFN